MTAELMDSIPASATRLPVSTAATSRFAVCLRRCAAAGIRLIVTTPSDTRAFHRGLSRFPERRSDPTEHVQWETAYRVFCGRGREPHDRGSWRILAVDHDDRVVGAITARFFCGEFVPEYLHMFSLLETTGPVFREHCEMAVGEVVAAAARLRRTPAEISNWAVAPGWHAALVAVTLARAMGALVAAFDAPLVILAADNRRGEVARLMRLGGAPLGLGGRYALPPFVHHTTGAWLRLLLVDAPAFHVRCHSAPAADLALLRVRAPIISMS
jgi:hypothetical protein